MNQHFTPYQISGIAKLLTYKNSLTPEADENRLPFKAALRKIPGAFKKKQAQSFINIFCEHLLADTDYDALQQNPIQYHSLQQDIEKMPLDSILKTITFIIWTDRSVEGYFYAKMHDKTLFYLLSRLESVFLQLRF
ncbi:DUF6508 domain-containing protein [Filimonas effusa]|uniref:Uncharacterized protein n=1 Tax=Filimonas effusa TaxID=2508721 RepID=A0A4Q1D810_9BACT|nr:DUF6508 domain-containing protein [Filimonas effusa]RXK85447.1 hypothetical protein ESB13_01075 [Filimonas effusa]